MGYLSAFEKLQFIRHVVNNIAGHDTEVETKQSKPDLTDGRNPNIDITEKQKKKID